jgi:hypothetical protein
VARQEVGTTGYGLDKRAWQSYIVRVSNRRAPKKKQARKAGKDVALLHGPTDDGEGARVLRFKDGAVYAGEVRPVREGQTITGQEVVRLTPVAEGAALCEVEVLHGGQESDGGTKHGPARVATENYRRNWNVVFGSTNKKPRADYSIN